MSDTNKKPARLPWHSDGSADRDPQKPADRLPPHAPDAERGVLGCCLLDGHNVSECIEKLRDASAFYDLRHRALFTEMLAMDTREVPIDVVTVNQWLRDHGKLDEVGGFEYFSALPDAGVSAANLGYFLEVVRGNYLKRRLIQACSGVVNDIYTGTGNVDEFFDKIEREILAVNETRVAAREMHIRVVLGEVVERIENYQRGGPQLMGLTTGFEYLDKMLLGMGAGDMVVIAARPGQGKTSMGMQIVEHLACDKKIPCGVFTLEMTANQLAARGLFSRALADFQRYRSGDMENVDVPKLIDTNLKMQLAPIWFDETSGINVLQLRARARRWHRQHQIQFLLVDYIQLMRPTRLMNNREQEVAEISGGLKALAKELKIPVLVLAQLNRELEKRPGSKPQLADLRESGSIEQDADVVGMLYKPKQDKKETQELERLNKEKGNDWSKKYRRINLL
ncbi:MAG TPA: replicative DNA helicase, partial [Pyrinomonadaceae bacterium]